MKGKDKQGVTSMPLRRLIHDQDKMWRIFKSSKEREKSKNKEKKEKEEGRRGGPGTQAEQDARLR